MPNEGNKWVPVLLLGCSLILIEFGFLYAYRTGWKIGTTSIIVSSFAAATLAFIGMLWYKEELSAINLLGIAFSIIGFVLINR